MQAFNWADMQALILQLETEGKVTRTFRRLDPARQQVIVTAILDEAVERGPTALNIKKVAERAEVSVGSLYTYFNNREGLLDFAVELCSRFITSTFAGFMPFFDHAELREALRMYVSGGLAWSETQMALVRFFARAAYHSDSDLADVIVPPVAEVMLDMVRHFLSQAAKRGEVRDDVDLEATARIIHALTIIIGDSQILPYLNAYFQVTDGDMPLDRVMDALVTLVLRGIGTQHE
ncbi:MAG: TetR/AcrR family transcriptional regulator [Chloroflexi bacterium]|nr:TetR/AcrR family transcriptional regulator [Chloroflexota bacterium]